MHTLVSKNAPQSYNIYHKHAGDHCHTHIHEWLILVLSANDRLY